MRSSAYKNNIERYDLDRSPFSQKPTKRDLSSLLGESLKDLITLSTPSFKDQFVIRRTEVIGKKLKKRDLVYPVSRLRGVHERLKFHLNKIKQPSYLFSPRKNKSQRDNALVHLDQDQYLTIDLKQFYPSTTALMVQKWFELELGMYEDVARLLTKLSTIDDKVSFGSPLTPVLCSLVHRVMFDKIANICENNDLRCTLWVDDLTISGRFVPGVVLESIRSIICNSGLQSHKIKYSTGNKPVFITGIGVVGQKLITQKYLNIKIKEQWDSFYKAQTFLERDYCLRSLLTSLGTSKYIVGSKSVAGQKISNQMNSLRQKKIKMHKEEEKQRKTKPKTEVSVVIDTSAADDIPF